MALCALLFDLDGTLIDTDELHLNAYNQLLARWGRSMDIGYYKAHVMGFPDRHDFLAACFPILKRSNTPRMAAEKEAMFRAQLVETIPVAGALRILDHAQETGLRTAVVTNAPRENAMAMLTGLGILDRFETIVIGGELARGKPHPMPYLTALELLGVTADQALAFEDSLAGVQSASAAGIHTFGMLSGLDEGQLRAAGARDIIRDFNGDALWRHLESPS
ncbi:HAD family hydrolase [Pseudomonas syringae]|uniref:HAD family hydrolase n=1 Tax=Pseudomonas syringae TaxID=317 RepID=UPI0004966653|nr:HAD-IA family hydrolase [Pseudomonas syringae]